MRTDLVPTTRKPHQIALYSERLTGYRTVEQLQFGMVILKIRAQQIAEGNPMSQIPGPWPPAWLFLPNAKPGSAEIILYNLLSDALSQSGYSFAVLKDIEVVKHAPHSLTVIEVNRRRQLISVQ